MKGLTILVGDCRSTLRTLAPESVDCVVTSPPYLGLRDYGVDGQIGREPSLKEYVGALVDTFAALRPALKPTGTVWLNLGDCYATTPAGSTNVKVVTRDKGFQFRNNPASAAQVGKAAKRDWAGMKQKDLMMVPASVAIALRDDGWWLRSHIVWAKPRPMPESVRDRPTAAHEEIFLLTKQGAGYFYEDPGVPVKESTVAIAGSYARRLEGGSFLNGNKYEEDGPRQYAGISSAEEKARNMARYAPPHGRPRPQTMHSPVGRRAVDAASKWEGGGDSPGKYARAKELEAEWRVGDRPTRRLRNAEQAPPPDAWWINPAMYPGAHFATFPPELVERCLAAGCPPGPEAVVLDPFGGAGTTALVALHTGRQAVLCELSEEYAELARRRVESGGRLDSDMRRQRHAERKRAEQEAHGQGSLI